MCIGYRRDKTHGLMGRLLVQLGEAATIELSECIETALELHACLTEMYVELGRMEQHLKSQVLYGYEATAPEGEVEHR